MKHLEAGIIVGGIVTAAAAFAYCLVLLLTASNPAVITAIGLLAVGVTIGVAIIDWITEKGR